MKKIMWIPILVIIGFIIVLIAVIQINSIRLDRENAQLAADLLQASKPAKGSVFNHEDLAGLPDPVQAYLKRAIPEGHPYVNTVRLQQTGDFRLGDQTAPWKPLTASQTFTTRPPGFIWDATIEMAPLISARVVDMYMDGKGALRAKVASTLTVADQPASAELNSGELIRYLAESVWFPTALLPGQGVEWTPIDDHSSMATITHQGISASLIFYFNGRHEVERVHSEGRYREVDGRFEPTPWTGCFRDYQTRDGLLIPLEGEVMWNLPEGDLAYWRGRLDKIEYEIME